MQKMQKMIPKKPFRLLLGLAGLAAGLAASYFMFGYHLYLAEAGRYRPWMVFTLAVPPMAGLLAGILLHQYRIGR